MGYVVEIDEKEMMNILWTMADEVCEDIQGYCFVTAMDHIKQLKVLLKAVVQKKGRPAKVCYDKLEQVIREYGDISDSSDFPEEAFDGVIDALEDLIKIL